jgi:hypothetical protein
MRKSNNITIKERQYLFDNGVYIFKTWMLPDRQWEYTVRETGGRDEYIAIRTTERAAYNAAIKWINKQDAEYTERMR